MEKRVQREALHKYYHFKRSLEGIGNAMTYEMVKREFENDNPIYESILWFAISSIIMFFKPTEDELINCLIALGVEIYE